MRPTLHSLYPIGKFAKSMVSGNFMFFFGIITKVKRNGIVFQIFTTLIAFDQRQLVNASKTDIS